MAECVRHTVITSPGNFEDAMAELRDWGRYNGQFEAPFVIEEIEVDGHSLKITGVWNG